MKMYRKNENTLLMKQNDFQKLLQNFFRDYTQCCAIILQLSQARLVQCRASANFHHYGPSELMPLPFVQ